MRAFFLFSAIFMLQANAYCKELKIVSLSPAVTEMIYQLGAENQLVGRSRVCDYPKQVSSLPIAGDLGTPDIERISKLRADVVISDVNNPAANWEQLRKMGVQIILLRSDSISRYRENIFSIGRVVGKEKNAEQEWNRFDGKMQILKNDSAKVKKVSAAVFLGINPLVSCNDETFIGELLELAGVDNISGKVKKKYFIISPEFILKKNPDIAISSGMSNSQSRKQLLEISLLRSAKFVRNNAIIDNVPDEYFCRLSPRTLLAVEVLKKAVKKYRKN